jgi:hypothetical protein
MSNRAQNALLLLQEALKIEFPTYTIDMGSDANGNPTMSFRSLATWVTTNPCAYIQIVQRTYTGFPIPSLAGLDDGRSHIIQVGLEVHAGLALTSYFLTDGFARLFKRIGELNMDTEIYYSLNTVRPIAATITGVPASVISANVRIPNMGQ